MRYILLVIGLTMLSLSSYGQQEHQFTQFMYNKVYYNPAFAGSRGVGSITALYRDQWIGFEGSPRSILGSFETPLFNQNSGFGLLLANHQIGIMNSWQGTMSYNYNIKFSEAAGLRIGLNGSLRTLSLDFNDPGVVIDQPNDNSIANGQTQYKGNFGVGAVLEMKKFHLGFSVPNIYANVIGEDDGQTITAEYAQHFYGIIGARPNLTDKISLQPTLLVSYVKNAPIDFDFNLSLLFNEKFLIGSSYRHGGTAFAESIDFNIFYQIAPRFGLGAAYDLHMGEVADLGTGSMEFLARIEFGKGSGNGAGGLRGKKLANPRYFF